MYQLKSRPPTPQQLFSVDVKRYNWILLLGVVVTVGTIIGLVGFWLGPYAGDTIAWEEQGVVYEIKLDKPKGTK